MVHTKAPWFRTPGIEEPRRARVPLPYRADEKRRREAREKRIERRPKAPIKPYQTPGRKPRTPAPVVPRERGPRPVSPSSRPQFGRKVPKLRIPGIGNPYLDFAEQFVKEQFPGINVSPYMAPAGWCVSAVCYTGPPQYWAGNIRRATIGRGGYNCTVNVDCLSGQAIPGTSSPWGDPITYVTTGPEIGLWWGYWAGGGSTARFKHHKSFYRPGPYVGPVTSIFSPRTWTMGIEQPLDPNLERYAPPRLLDKSDAKFVVGYASPVRSPATVNNPDSPYQEDHAWQFEVGVGFATPPLVGGVPAVPVAPVAPPIRPPLAPVVRAPPAKGEKQAKALSKTKAAVMALYRALDYASETAEVVDAIYEALPDDVKKRWKRPDRLGDNFGQYGLGGADWKAQAIYWNLHRLDVPQAFRNIIKNELQDQIIGGTQRVLPNNTGNAHAAGEKELAKQIDRYLEEELGL